MNSFVPLHERTYTYAAEPSTLLVQLDPSVNYSFQWITEGSARWQYSGPHTGGEYVLDTSTILLTRPYMRASIRFGPRTRGVVVGFEHARPLDDAELPIEESWPLVRTVRSGDPIRPLLRHIFRLQNAPEGRPVAAEAIKLALTFFVQDHHLESREVLPPPLRAAVEYVRGVWADGVRAVSVAELVDAAKVSRVYLSRLFRAEFGAGPSSALEALRLSHAATLLTTSALTLHEVARACGFADGYHLSRRFRQQYGVPPGRYRCDPSAPTPLSPLHGTGLERLSEQLLFFETQGAEAPMGGSPHTMRFGP